MRTENMPRVSRRFSMYRSSSSIVLHLRLVFCFVTYEQNAFKPNSWLVAIISLLPFAGSFIAGFLLGFKLG
jgi:uncharacterized membrane protein (Fun14 family)